MPDQGPEPPRPFSGTTLCLAFFFIFPFDFLRLARPSRAAPLWAPQKLPDPHFDAAGVCNRHRPSNIFDPDGILGPRYADKIDDAQHRSHELRTVHRVITVHRHRVVNQAGRGAIAGNRAGATASSVGVSANHGGAAHNQRTGQAVTTALTEKEVLQVGLLRSIADSIGQMKKMVMSVRLRAKHESKSFKRD